MQADTTAIVLNLVCFMLVDGFLLFKFYILLKFRKRFKYGLRAYAPSGRVGQNLRNFSIESTLKSSFWFFSLQNAI